MSTTTINISGMHCASCVKLVGKTLKKIPDVEDVSVNLALNQAYVTSSRTLNMDLIKNKVADIGYKVIFRDTNLETDIIEIELKTAKQKLIFVWLTVLPVVAIYILEMLLNFPISLPLRLITLLFAGIAIFIPGWQTISSGFKNLFHGNPTMDSLIAMGTTVSFATGPLTFFSNQIGNFTMGGALIMAFHLTGRYIETLAKGKTSESIKKLLNLAPKTARILITHDRKSPTIQQFNNETMRKKLIEKKVLVDSLTIGNVLLVKPGEKIPTDGIIVKGESEIDQSLVTGESMPTLKKTGDEVLGATINQDGLLFIKVTKIGKDTFLSQIIELVKQAQSSKIPIQQLVDQVTGVFVPLILIIAGLTFITWFIFPNSLLQINYFIKSILTISTLSTSSTFSLALFAAIAVLVIACPCALGLATPTALMIASGLGASKGILIRKGEALQKMKDVKSIIFDKTGTLTLGKPEVTDVLTSHMSNLNINNLLEIAASAESGSEHPIAKALINKAKNQKLTLSSPNFFKNLPGKGITCVLNKFPVVIGTKNLLNENKIIIDKDDLKQIKDLENHGKTVIHVAVSDKYVGSVAVADALKPEAASVIHSLQNMGYEINLVTGDNLDTAYAISDKLNISHSNVYAQVLPYQKAEIVKNIQSKTTIPIHNSPNYVAFVGDGINDAPALTSADVGFAMGNGTDIAIESGDIVLVNSKLTTLLSAIKLSQKTFAKIRSNLFWAFAYNVIAIPVAMLGLLHPVVAEIGMAFSSIAVVTNANLLRKANI